MAESLVQGSNPTARRMVKGTVADNGVPTLDSHGFLCDRFSLLKFEFECIGGTSTTFAIYFFSAVSGKWDLDITIGTDGVATLLADTSYSPILPTGGANRVFIRTQTFAGGSKANAWAEGSNP